MIPLPLLVAKHMVAKQQNRMKGKAEISGSVCVLGVGGVMRLKLGPADVDLAGESKQVGSWEDPVQPTWEMVDAIRDLNHGSYQEGYI